MDWNEAFARLNGVRDELEAARAAVAHTQAALRAGEAVLKGAVGVRPSHMARCGNNLQRTYALRLFAEFEGILRAYWAVARPVRVQDRRRRTSMETLLNRIAVICTIPFDVLDSAHDVRKYRNSLIHDDGTEDVVLLDFQECKSRVGTFLSHLPTRW